MHIDWDAPSRCRRFDASKVSKFMRNDICFDLTGTDLAYCCCHHKPGTHHGSYSCLFLAAWKSLQNSLSRAQSMGCRQWNYHYWKSWNGRGGWLSDTSNSTKMTHRLPFDLIKSFYNFNATRNNGNSASRYWNANATQRPAVDTHNLQWMRTRMRHISLEKHSNNLYSSMSIERGERWALFVEILAKSINSLAIGHCPFTWIHITGPLNAMYAGHTETERQRERAHGIDERRTANGATIC